MDLKGGYRSSAKNLQERLTDLQMYLARDFITVGFRHIIASPYPSNDGVYVDVA